MQEKWETYFHDIWHFVNCHVLVGTAYKWQTILIFLPNGRCNISFFFFLHLCDPCEFRWRSKYRIFMLQKVSKNRDFVRERVRKFHCWWPAGNLTAWKHSIQVKFGDFIYPMRPCNLIELQCYQLWQRWTATAWGENRNLLIRVT